MNQTDYDFGHCLDRQVSIIVGHSLVRRASAEDDMIRATDYEVIKSTEGLPFHRIGSRLRRWGKYPPNKFIGEVTIRFSVPSGARTEWEKVFVDGYMDAMLYGWVLEKRITYWTLVDMHILRRVHEELGGIDGMMAAELLTDEIRNPDNTTFRGIRWAKMPQGFVIRQSRAFLEMAA